MSLALDLESRILRVQDKILQCKVKRNEYLSRLKDVLDIYVFSVMEEEDTVYNLLQQHSVLNNFNTLKIQSPFHLQFKLLITLPFTESQIEVESGDPGFVKLKLPNNIEDSVKQSRIWIDACHRGAQQTLIRHISAWKDDNNYLKQSAVLKWLKNIVDKSVNMTGRIPNYHVRLLQEKNKVVLELEDVANALKFIVDLLPVLVLPLNLLPQGFSDVPNVSLNPSYDKWIAECRSNETASDQFWGVSFWQQERQIIRDNNLKPMIHLIKSLRNGCQWMHLTNYHIRTHVLLEHKKDPLIFETLSSGLLLLHLLLQLRNRLVSRDGLPFLWDNCYNLLGGLTGHQRSELARAVTKTKESLETLSENWCNLFGLETYAKLETPPKVNPPPEVISFRAETSEQPQSQPRATRDQSNSLPPQPHVQLTAERHTPGGNQMHMHQEGGIPWWQKAIAGSAAVVGAAAVAFAVIQKNRNKNN